MERPVNKCGFCNTKLEKMHSVGWICPSIGCNSLDGNSRFRMTYFSSFDEFNKKRATKEPKKTTPLTTDDILDIRIWSKEIKHHELHYLIRAKRRT